jgi:hypothetical protein
MVKSISTVLLVSLALAVPTSVYAARTPTPHERAALLAATSYAGQIPPRREWAAKKIWVSNLRVSTVNHSWATGTINTLFAGEGDDKAGLLYHFRARTWHLRTLGTSSLGCGVPPAVIKDLGGGWLDCTETRKSSEEESEASCRARGGTPKQEELYPGEPSSSRLVCWDPGS